MDKRLKLVIAVGLIAIISIAPASAFNLWDWLTGRGSSQSEMDVDRGQEISNVRQRAAQDEENIDATGIYNPNNPDFDTAERVVTENQEEPLIAKDLGRDPYEAFNVDADTGGTETPTGENEAEDYPDPTDFPTLDSYKEYFGTIDFEDVVEISYTMNSEKENKYIVFLSLYTQEMKLRYYPQFHTHELGKLLRLELTFEDYEEAQSMYYLLKNTYLESMGKYPNFMMFRINFRSTDCVGKKYISPDSKDFDKDSDYENQFVMSICRVPFDDKGDGMFELKTISPYAYKMYYG